MNSKAWTDDELMAYADEQLGAERRAQLAAALAADAALRQRVDALVAQRRRVAAAYADVLDEPVPDRLAALLAPSAPAAAVVDLSAARERRAAARRPGLGWLPWGGMAAGVVLGLVLGLQMGVRGNGEALLAEADGQVVAGARLTRALATQAGGAAAAGDGIAVQLSFVAKDGRYCRTFSTERVAGLACRDAAQWTVQTAVAAAPSEAPSTGMRQAAASLPAAVLEAVDAHIEGTALTAAQEQAARARGWRP